MKTRNLFVLSFIAIFIGLASCRDDFDFDLATNNLSFSKDTLDLDTIFNHTNSQTYKVTVHNRENKDVQVPKISLARGESSFFKINVDGMSGHEFENIAIRAKDSIFIFVEIAAGDVAANALYEDEIKFETSNGEQHVKLLSYLERAIFYNTDLQTDFDLGNLNWDNQYARVIYGDVKASDVNIGPGTRIYFHDNASMTINGALNVNGNINQKVVFRTDRHDEYSESLPKTWNKFVLKSNNSTTQSTVNHAYFKGMNEGIIVEDSKLDINNSYIYNNEKFGLRGYNSTINGRNTVIAQSDQAALGLEGGTYDFRHCTIANFFGIGSGAGLSYGVILSNDGAILTQANFYNNIIYNSSQDAVFFDNVGTSGFNHDFKNNVIKNNSGTITLDASNKNVDPKFIATDFDENDFRLLFESEASGVANSSYNTGIGVLALDILGATRTSPLTAGAYQVLIDPATLD